MRRGSRGGSGQCPSLSLCACYGDRRVVTRFLWCVAHRLHCKYSAQWSSYCTTSKAVVLQLRRLYSRGGGCIVNTATGQQGRRLHRTNGRSISKRTTAPLLPTTPTSTASQLINIQRQHQHRRHHQQQQRNIFHNTNNRNLKHEPRVTALHPLYHSSLDNNINADDIATKSPPTQKQPEHFTDVDNNKNISSTTR